MISLIGPFLTQRYDWYCSWLRQYSLNFREINLFRHDTHWFCNVFSITDIDDAFKEKDFFLLYAKIYRNTSAYNLHKSPMILTFISLSACVYALENLLIPKWKRSKSFKYYQEIRKKHIVFPPLTCKSWITSTCLAYASQSKNGCNYRHYSPFSSVSMTRSVRWGYRGVHRSFWSLLISECISFPPLQHQ